MRRTADKWQMGVAILTLCLAVFGTVYMIVRDRTTDTQRAFERFEDKMAEVVKIQNAAIEELRDRCPPKRVRR